MRITGKLDYMQVDERGGSFAVRLDTHHGEVNIDGLPIDQARDIGQHMHAPVTITIEPGA